MRKAYHSSSAYAGRERAGSLSVLFLEPLAFWEITSVKCHLRDQAVDWCHFFPGPFPKHTNAKVSKSLCRLSLGSHSTGNAHVWASSCWNLLEEENEGTEHQADSCLGRSGDKKTIPILFHDSLPSSEYNAHPPGMMVGAHDSVYPFPDLQLQQQLQLLKQSVWKKKKGLISKAQA